eukprot:6839476-Karenia_brevis.AAC.1
MLMMTYHNVAYCDDDNDGDDGTAHASEVCDHGKCLSVVMVLYIFFLIMSVSHAARSLTSGARRFM